MVLGCAGDFLGCRQTPNPKENLPGVAGLQGLIPPGVMALLRSAPRIPCLCPMDMEGSMGAWWSHPGEMLLPSILVPLEQPSWGRMKGLEVFWGDVTLQMLPGKHLSSPYGSLSASHREPWHCHP